MDPALSDLVSEAANAEREALQERDFSVQRQRFLAHASRRRMTRRAVRWFVPLAAAAAVLVLSLAALRTPRALSFEVHGRRGEPRDWLTTSGREPLAIAFSDGSSMRLTGDARARVTELSGDGAGVVLERGSLKAHVVHDQSTNWRFDAGPFRIRVLGTTFDMDWDPARERFVLTLKEGSVAVSGPKLQAGCIVQAGRRLEIELGAGTGSGPCVPNAPKQVTSVEPELPSAPVAPPVTAVVAPPSWQALAQRGDYRAAWALVSAVGFDQVKQRATAKDLLALADLARYAHESAHATEALVEVRQRFAGSAEASHAAFLLGRIAADQQGAPLRGADWFASYLSERPNGPFAPEALGRLLECQNRAGHSAASRKTAAGYLQRYPTGAYAALARHVLDAASEDQRR
ncbi:MAG TPA: FecR domain-containing protein [Polyangiaceae bacterium]|nr:FecR domain-containing protein [Polyangiaceae bacterium]